MIKIAIIGFGYWGPNMTRNFNILENVQVEYVCDKREERLAQVKSLYPSIQITADFEQVLSDKEVRAVVIATPVFLHYTLAKKALEAGKHVLVEKPITSKSKEAKDLIRIAKDRRLSLMVDHTFLYTGAVQKIKSLVSEGEIGSIQYFDSIRINLGLFQPDVNVLWDLAPHDISILNYLVYDRPKSVIATGIAHTNTGFENIAYMTLKYQKDRIAHFNCSWTSPVKIRKILIGGSKKMILFDDIEPTEKVKIYDSGYQVIVSDEDKRKLLIDYRIGDVAIPKIEQTEALKGVAEDFIHSIVKGSTPIASAESGLEVVRILEAAQESIIQGGKEVEIKV